MLLCVALGCSLFVGCGSKNNDADATKKENVSESKKEEIPLATPKENIDAFLYAIRKYGAGAQIGHLPKGLESEL